MTSRLARLPLLPTLGLVALLALGAAPRAALAAPAGPKALHKKALAAAKAGQYDKAFGLWQQASLDGDDPLYLYHLGDMSQRLGKNAQALRYYERFLKRTADSGQYPDLRARATAAAKGLRDQGVTTRPAPAPGATPGAGSGPGSAPGAPPGARPLPVTPAPPAGGQELRRLVPAWVPWTVLGAGLVFIGGGAGLFVYSSNRYAAFDDSTATGDSDRSLLDAARASRSAGYAFFGIGGAALVTGIVLFVLNRPRLMPARHADTDSGTAPRFMFGASPTPGGLHLTLSGQF